MKRMIERTTHRDGKKVIEVRSRGGIKAAYFMSRVTTERLGKSGKTWTDVFNALVEAMNNDTWCLWGRKMALVAYSELSGTQFSGVFAFDEATKDWHDRKQEILKNKGSQ